MLQMSRCDGFGKWTWLQTARGEKIGLHYHPFQRTDAAVVDSKPVVEGPLRHRGLVVVRKPNGVSQPRKPLLRSRRAQKKGDNNK